MESAGGNPGYALGHSEREIGRLSAQAKAFEPFTRRMLQTAGISTGMRILDVGSGAGDVAFLCASLVGPAGGVIGVDVSPEAVERSTERANRAGLDNVKFEVGDAAHMPLVEPFDAAVGRLVLMHQAHPVALLRNLSRLVHPGGIIAFQEFDISAALSFPPSPAFERCLQWIVSAFSISGTDTRMGVKLYSAFIDAGLPAPSMSLDAGIWGGSANPAATLITDVIRTLSPVLMKAGIATEEQIGIDSLRARIEDELQAADSVAISPSLIGAWTRVPA